VPDDPANRQDRAKLENLSRSFWRHVDEASFRALWDAEVAEARDRVEIETVHIATGLLLPVWHKLPADDVRVWRIVDEATGESRLGRIISADMLAATAESFDVADAVRLTPSDLIAAAALHEGAPIEALPGARLARVRVNGQPRLEIRDYPFERLDWLKSLGCFTEIISYRTRLFIPPDQAEAILTAMDPATS
jgi:hypothetical protein